MIVPSISLVDVRSFIPHTVFLHDGDYSYVKIAVFKFCLYIYTQAFDLAD